MTAIYQLRRDPCLGDEGTHTFASVDDAMATAAQYFGAAAPWRGPFTVGPPAHDYATWWANREAGLVIHRLDVPAAPAKKRKVKS